MRRDKNLLTLSWEHHDGLKTALRLNRGLDRQVDVKILRDYLLYVWQNDLQHHFEQEEQALLQPEQNVEAGRQLIERVLSEHKKFAELIENVKKEQGAISEILSEFAALLERHIRFEEREFYSFVESNLSKAKLEEIGAYLKAEHRTACSTWQPEFWK